MRSASVRLGSVYLTRAKFLRPEILVIVLVLGTILRLGKGVEQGPLR